MHQYRLTYIGHGMWRDNENKLWGPKDVPTRSIEHSRVYESDMGMDQFLASRSDFEFMVGYGALVVDHIEVGDDGMQVVEQAEPIPEEPISEFTAYVMDESEDEVVPVVESIPEPIDEPVESAEEPAHAARKVIM